MIQVFEFPVVIEDRPIFPEEYTLEGIADIHKNQGDYIFSTQYMLNPVTPEDCIFKGEWLTFYEKLPNNLIYYLLCDPANSTKKKSDYTAMVVLGVGKDENGLPSYYLADMVRDRLDVQDRVNKYFELAGKWKIHTGTYEAAGLSSDHQLIEMRRKDFPHKFVFKALTVARSINGNSKFDRILAMQPIYQQRRFLWPKMISYSSSDMKQYVNLVDALKTEYLTFSKRTVESTKRHDDMLDAMSQIFLEDVFVRKPMKEKEAPADMTGTWAEHKKILKKFDRLKNFRTNAGVPSYKIWQRAAAMR